MRQIPLNEGNNFQTISFYIYGRGELNIKIVFIKRITICLYIIFVMNINLNSAGEVLFIENDFYFYVILKSKVRLPLFLIEAISKLSNFMASYWFFILNKWKDERRKVCKIQICSS